MQLKLECSCGANVYWNADDNPINQRFAMNIYNSFRNDHIHCRGLYNPTDQDITNELELEDQYIVNEFITNQDMGIAHG